MVAVRGALAQQDTHGKNVPGREGPPEFVLEAHRALLASLTEVLARHRGDLRVEPERAALMLRSLVLGSRHPGIDPAHRLTAEEITTVLVSGITGTGLRS